VSAAVFGDFLAAANGHLEAVMVTDGSQAGSCTAPKCRNSSDLQVLAIRYAARWYSLITPPRTCRRCTSVSSGMTAGSS
jgi:hypothetical protein